MLIFLLGIRTHEGPHQEVLGKLLQWLEVQSGRATSESSTFL